MKLEERLESRTHLVGTMNLNRYVNGNPAIISQDTFKKAAGFGPKIWMGTRLTDRPQSTSLRATSKWENWPLAKAI